MVFLDHWLLTIVLLVPAAGGIIALLLPSAQVVRWTALGIAAATFLLSLLVLAVFHWNEGSEYRRGAGGTVQMANHAQLAPAIHAGYSVAIDGLSFPFIVLTTFLSLLACAASVSVDHRPRLYFALLLFFEATVLGSFLAFDFLLLCVFQAMSVIPACLLIGIWGGPRRARAAVRLFGYLLVGLACLLISLIGTHIASRQVFAPRGSLDLIQLASAPMHQALSATGMTSAARLWFILAMVGFLVRLAVVPLHHWLVDVIAQSSAPIGLLLGALIPATGGYGIFRVAYAIFPAAARSLWPAFAIVGVVTILYAALCAMARENPKRLVGYGSVSLLGFVLLGAAVLTPAGANGAVFVLIAYGLLLGSPLLAAEGLGRATSSVHSTILGWLGWLVVPGMLGQVIVLLGVFQATRPELRLPGSGRIFILAAAGCAGVLLSGAYAIRAIRRLVGRAIPPEHVTPAGTERRDAAITATLAATAFLLGIFATPLCFAFTRRALEAILSPAR